MKYFVALIIILLIILHCMSCLTIDKKTSIYIIEPVIKLELNNEKASMDK